MESRWPKHWGCLAFHHVKGTVTLNISSVINYLLFILFRIACTGSTTTWLKPNEGKYLQLSCKDLRVWTQWNVWTSWSCLGLLQSGRFGADTWTIKYWAVWFLRLESGPLHPVCKCRMCSVPCRVLLYNLGSGASRSHCSAAVYLMFATVLQSSFTSAIHSSCFLYSISPSTISTKFGFYYWLCLF